MCIVEGDSMYLIKKAVFLVVSGFFLVLSGLASAHHGWSWYTGSDFSLEGVVVEKHFGAPHDRLTIEAGGQQWNVVLSTPFRSRRAGFGQDEVEVGETVTAYGHRHAEATNFEMKTERLKVGDQLYNLYPNRN